MNTPKRTKRTMIFYYLAVIVALLLINSLLMPNMFATPKVEIDYSSFLKLVDSGQVEQVEIGDTTISALVRDKSGVSIIYQTGLINDPDLADRLLDSGVKFGRPVEQQSMLTSLLSLVLGWVLPIGLSILVGQLLIRSMTKRMGGGMGAMSFGKANAKIYVEAQTGKTFADVAGQDEAKDALIEIVDFLHNPKRYEQIGATIPKGVLLVGPPGTGKTLLAKAVAGEAKVPFFSISGSEFVEMFVGMGAAKVRDLFKQAGEKAPCIVFIDEIDTIGKRRDGTTMISGNDEREQTLNQLLSEMDGFDGRKGVILLAATNRPEILDKALLRPGRFDRRVQVELPDLQGRIAILNVHARKVHTSDNIDFEAIARATPGASGADLANIVNEAALHAVRQGRESVMQDDLEEAVETVIAGAQRKSAVISPKEKRIVAYHEIGHALVAALQTDSAPVHKITIVPRTSGALGYTMQVESEENRMMTRDEALSRLTTLTAGRAAEELVLGLCSSGAANDIEQATRLARSMVTRLGMSEEFGMMALEATSNQYLGGDQALACSPDTAARIDRAVLEYIRTAHDKATQILRDNVTTLHKLAERLMQQETMSGEEFMQLLSEAG